MGHLRSSRILGLPLLLLVLEKLAISVKAEPTSLTWTDCTSNAIRTSSNYDSNERINVTDVFGQIAYPDGQKTLSLTVLADTREQVIPSETDSGGNLILSTLFTRTSILTFTINENRSWFCDNARPPSPLPDVNTTTNTYCPLPSGALAWPVDTPLLHDYNLTTIITRVRIVDPSDPGRELTCVDISATPLRPDNSKVRSLGYPQILFWVSAGVAIAYWVVIGAARISNAWSRGVATGPGWSAVRWAGTIFASAVSAERLSTHSALLRFATPSYRDVLFHTQWCAALAMIAVQWPMFAYPMLSNAAWSALIYNITIIADSNKAELHWDPFSSNFSPPAEFADQISDPSSPLYLDSSLPNELYGFPEGTLNGMESFAYAVGVRPQDLFGICLKLWLMIVGVAVLVSVGIWFIDWFISSCTTGGRRTSGLIGSGGRRGSINDLTQYAMDSPSGSGHAKEASDLAILRGGEEELPTLPRSATKLGGFGLKRRWWNYRLGQSSFHGSVLQGNLVRLLIIFHLPITIFSTYEFSRENHPTGTKPEASSFTLAALVFAVISVIIPSLLIAKLALTPTKKLYDATRTLLALGPLYSHYAHGAQMFAGVVMAHSLAVGIIVGVGQKSGTAQTIVILVVEVASALATSIWLPWGERASMGIISFLFCVARIVTVVLLIILSPLVSVGAAAGGWIAYAIILIQGLVYLAFLLMLVIKIFEGLIRLFGRVPFDKATHSMDSGLLGALSQAGIFGMRRAKRRKGGKKSGGVPGVVGHTRTAGSPTGSAGATAAIGGAAGAGTLASRPGYSTLGSGSFGGTQQSFLRPEQAFQPYREDADDETGYIMGAWAEGGGPGYQPVNTQDAAASSPVGTPGPSSGFSRVGGGRAHYNDPFATLPSGSGSSAQAQGGRPRQQSSGGSGTAPLPPGAMAPSFPAAGASSRSYANQAGGQQYAHSRMQSHAAVIENVAPLVPPRTFNGDDDSSATSSTHPKKPAGGGFWQRRNASSPGAADRQNSFDDDDDVPELERRRRAGSNSAGGKTWFGRLLHRSDPGSGRGGDDGSELSAPMPSASGDPESGAKPGFVVVRGKKPSGASASSAPKSPGPQPSTSTSPSDAPPPSSFVVVRPKRISLPSSSSLSPPAAGVDKRAST